ncbi:MAG TPA: hypothetical protein VLF67_00480, partial [Candidatus Saccharimonas sp.]|nr:hypothetical protein [Candidatus Saccharimonas sp.]
MEAALKRPREPMTPKQRSYLYMVLGAVAAYIILAVTAPHTQSSSNNQYHFPLVVVVLLSLSIVGLLFLAFGFGYYAWLELDRYSRRLSDPAAKRAYGQIARGMWWLAAGLILSSLVSASQPFYSSTSALAAVMMQINYYVITVFPFFAFLWLRIGSRHLAVSAQALMSTRSKLVTVGPPVLLLASFYVFLALTNSQADLA